LKKERIPERINTNLNVKYFCCNELKSGIITNLSENDMYMKTNPCCPVNTIFEILIPSEDKILKVSVKIMRISKEGNDYVGMGLKLLGQTEKYLNFVKKLNPTLAN